MRKFLTIFIFIIVAAAGLFIYWKYFYVFGEGVKSGYLNYIVKKGDVFKTWEGKLIQEGIQSKPAGSIQSNDFEFSVVDDSLANTLQMNSGKIFDLHYKEYHAKVAWRGYTSFIVDKIIRIREPQK